MEICTICPTKLPHRGGPADCCPYARCWGPSDTGPQMRTHSENGPTLQLWDSTRLSRCGTPRFLVLLPIFPNPSTSVPCVTFPSFNHPRDTEAPTVVIKDHVFMSPPLVSHLFTCGSFPLTRLPYITAIIPEIQQLLLHHFTDVLVPPDVTRFTHCVPVSTMDWLSCTPCIWFDLVHFGNHNSDTSKGACRACTGNT